MQAQDFEENPKKVFMNYEKNEMIRFIKPPPKLVVGFGTMLNNPYVLSCEIPKVHFSSFLCFFNF